MHGQGGVRVGVRFCSEEGAATVEWLWASPVEIDGAGGTYQLQQHAFRTRLAAGDLVRAEPDDGGALYVVDIVRPAPAVLTLVGRVWDAPVDLEQVLERWAAAGARLTEGSAGALATVWAEGMPPEAVLEVMRPELDAETLELLDVSLPGHRTRAALEGDIDFEGHRWTFE